MGQVEAFQKSFCFRILPARKRAKCLATTDTEGEGGLHLTQAGWCPSRLMACHTGKKWYLSSPHFSNFLRTTTDDLEGLFDKYGRIGDVYIPKDYRTKESRGFGFVRYFNKWVLNADFGSHWRADESISKQFTDISIFLITFLLGMTLKTPSTDWTDASMMGGSWVSSMQGEI